MVIIGIMNGNAINIINVIIEPIIIANIVNNIKNSNALIMFNILRPPLNFLLVFNYYFLVNIFYNYICVLSCIMINELMIS